MESDESIDTKYYRALSAEDQTRFCMSLSRLTDTDKEMKQHSTHFYPDGQDQFHVMNTTIYLNDDFDRFITFTGYPSEIERAKSFLERKTEVRLQEIDPNEE